MPNAEDANETLVGVLETPLSVTTYESLKIIVFDKYEYRRFKW